MEEKRNLNEKITNARADMSLAKNQKNNFGNFSYRSIEDIWEKLVSVCEKHKITYTITKEEAEMKGNFLVFHFEAEFCDCESEERISTSMDVPMTSFEKKGMDSNQVFGAFLSYNRKYLVCRDFQIRAGLTELDSDDEINTIYTKIDQCQTIEEVLALRPMIEKIKESQNKDKASRLANEKYKELKVKNSQPAQPSQKQVAQNNTEIK
ncbi:MAG: ERF family protein [Bacteroidota bacterium]|nr:ERF family protein [Bacteroidota bacterium]